MRTTLAVFLTIDCDTEGAADGCVDDLLDVGFLQDAINEELPNGRVRCAVVRAVPAELLATYSAAFDDDLDAQDGETAPKAEPELEVPCNCNGPTNGVHEDFCDTVVLS